MKKAFLLIGALALFFIAANVKAQAITCDSEFYYPDIHGYIDIYCNIKNNQSSTINEKVGFIFDDWLDEEVEIIDVLVKSSTDADWNSIKPNINPKKLPEKRTKQLSQQNIQIKNNKNVNLHLRIKVPFGSSGKFDVMYGDYVLDPWWNSSWQYRQNFTITYNGYDISDYQIRLALNETIFNYSNANSDGSDLRLLYNEDGYEMPICIKSWNNTGYSEIWTRMNITTNMSINITLYYGNPNATSISNCSNVFDFWEDWSGYANETLANETGRYGFNYTIFESFVCSMPQILEEEGRKYLYWYSYCPYSFLYTLSNITLRNYSLSVESLNTKQILLYGNQGFGTDIKIDSYPSCMYQEGTTNYPCGYDYMVDNMNGISINFFNSSTAYYLNLSGLFFENSYPFKLYTFQIEGDSIKGYIIDMPTREILDELTYNGLTEDNRLLDESQISLVNRWRETKVYDIYVRKFTFNEPVIYPQNEMPYINPSKKTPSGRISETVPAPFNIIAGLTLGAGFIFLILNTLFAGALDGTLTTRKLIFAGIAILIMAFLLSAVF